ncbi:hypothetical protein MN608_11068 [Microdochium nivale]|nr:hypothetical protein MN608_11068 [Microdochium nivale]
MVHGLSQNRSKCEYITQLIDENIVALQTMRNKFVLLRAATDVSQFIFQGTEELASIAVASGTSVKTQAEAMRMFCGHTSTRQHIKDRHDKRFAEETRRLVSQLAALLNDCQKLEGDSLGMWMFVGKGSMVLESPGASGLPVQHNMGRQRQTGSSDGTCVGNSSPPGRLAQALDADELKDIGRITLGDWIDAALAPVPMTIVRRGGRMEMGA